MVYETHLTALDEMSEKAAAFLRDYCKSRRTLRTAYEIELFKYALREWFIKPHPEIIGPAFPCIYFTWEPGKDELYRTKIGGVPLRPRNAAWPKNSDGEELCFVAQFIISPAWGLKEIGCDAEVILLYAKKYSDDPKQCTLDSGLTSEGQSVSLGCDVFVEGWLMDDVRGDVADNNEKSAIRRTYLASEIISEDYPSADDSDDLVGILQGVLGGGTTETDAFILTHYGLSNIPISKVCKCYWGTDRDCWSRPAGEPLNEGDRIPILQFCGLEEYMDPPTLRSEDGVVLPIIPLSLDTVQIGGRFSYVVEGGKQGFSGFYV